MVHACNYPLLQGILSEIIHGMSQNNQKKKGAIKMLLWGLGIVFLIEEWDDYKSFKAYLNQSLVSDAASH